MTAFACDNAGGALVVHSASSIAELPEESWHRLAADLASEAGLLSLSAAALRAQARAGVSAVAAIGPRIVSHISCLSLLDDTTRRSLGLPAGPAVGVFMSGWTHPRWRRRSLSRRLREQLCSARTGLVVSRTFGLGASVVLDRMGFVLRDTDALPYLSSLMGWPTAAGHYQVRTGKTGWPHLRPYTGPHRSPLTPDGHDWQGCVHLWVSDAEAADRVEASLRATGPLQAWRQKVVAARSGLLMPYSAEDLRPDARVLYTAARARGYSVQILDPQVLRMSNGTVWWYTWGPSTPLLSVPGRWIADHKDLARTVLASLGAPVARGVLIRRRADLAGLQALSPPWVAKPRVGTHGRGVVLGLTTLAEVEGYLDAHAAELDPGEGILLEETLEGTDYRILCVEHRVIAVMRRSPPAVTGDGRRSIAALIAAENASQLRGPEGPLPEIPVDQVVTDHLAHQGLRLGSVLPAGAHASLRDNANLATGGRPVTAHHELCAENRALFERLTRGLDLNIAGFDVKCQTLARPLSAQPRAGVIEVNAVPGIAIHQHPVEGEPVDVAGAILDMIARRFDQLPRLDALLPAEPAT